FEHVFSVISRRRFDMRRFLSALLILVPAAVFAANPATFESRSEKYALVIDAIPIGDDVEYAARVSDLRSGELLATAKFFPNDGIAEAGSDFKELHITIHLRPTYNGLSASAQIRKAATVVDEIEGRWMFPQGRA